jgi:hypothetical protein
VVVAWRVPLVEIAYMGGGVRVVGLGHCDLRERTRRRLADI